MKNEDEEIIETVNNWEKEKLELCRIEMNNKIQIEQRKADTLIQIKKKRQIFFQETVFPAIGIFLAFIIPIFGLFAINIYGIKNNENCVKEFVYKFCENNENLKECTDIAIKACK